MGESEEQTIKRQRRAPRPVSPEAYADAYALAQQVLEGSLSQPEAEKILTARYDLGDRVALGYIGNYLSMKRGVPKVRSTIAADGWRFFLDSFEQEGALALQRALSVLWEHIEYLPGPEPKLRKVHADYIGKLAQHIEGDPVATLAEQVAASLKGGDEARAQRLDVAPVYPESVLVATRAFRRNADVIAEVLGQAAGICQGCRLEAPFKRPDGTPYLEVHHRQPLAEGGADTVENAIALCPNCHRERHYGAGYRDREYS
ncbi:HNH endonuclease [Paraburkholderia sp. EG287A]|uniref:HNH endonuclease n=1 Tax=Paraburkholderia sp. EG287A TaxID=3237012 RepID=UPI0034D33CD7